MEILKMGTEDIDPRFLEIDSWSSLEAINAMAAGQAQAISAVSAASDMLALAVDESYKRLLGTKGRLIYVGAGTSGRIAVQDGVELFPTYGWPWERMVFSIAGGEKALLRAVENAEDDFDAGYISIKEINPTKDDIVIGVAASGRTPYVLGAIEAGKEKGALCLGFSNNANGEILEKSDIGILIQTGAEPVTGSTRMKAGTAQKVALNLYSTALMIKLGGVYKGQMVGMKATNQKLRNRATRIIMATTNCNENSARSAIERTNGDLKIAILLVLGLGEMENLEKALIAANGKVAQAINLLSK